MRTDDLIRALAADHERVRAWSGWRLAGALAPALLASALLFATALGPRPDISAAVHDPRFVMKFVETLTLAGTTFVVAVALARPGPFSSWGMLAVGPALLLAGVAFELVVVPASQWMPRLVGTNALVCLSAVPLLSVPLLAAALVALRAGAPLSPAKTGAAAGLIAGGLAAALYAAHCTDDSPLFVATWYSLAIGLVVVAGALIGARVLRW